MNIFYKRPLSLILCVLLGGFVFSAYGGAFARIITASLGALLLLWAVFKKLKGDSAKTVLIFILCICLLFGSLTSYLCFDLWKKPQIGKEVTITAKITELEENENYSSRITLKTDTVDSRSVKTKITMTLSTEQAKFVTEGQTVSLRATLRDIGKTDSFDARSYYFSQGIYAAVDECSEFTVNSNVPIKEKSPAEKISENVSRHSVLVLGEDAGALFCAVFMGNREFLDSSVTLNFKRIGITHILALSGMHLAILAAALTRVLAFLRVRKKPRTVIIIAATLAYMTLTGFSVSVVRAGIMVILSSLLFLLASAKDSLTNLLISVTLIVAVSPSSIFDYSLWLSALATLGIIAMSELWHPNLYKKPIAIRVLAFILTSVLSSFFALCATVAITCAFSGTLSVFSVLSTLIFSLLFELFIYLGIIALVLGSVLPIGQYIMYPLTRLILWLSEAMSKPTFALISTSGICTKIAIIALSVLFFLFLILKVKRKRAFLSVILLFFVLIYATGGIDTYTALSSDTVTVSSADKSDLIIIKDDCDTAVVDVSSYNAYSSYSAVNTLTDERIYSPDAYILTHYSYGLTDYFGYITSNIKIGTILIPEPMSDEESGILKSLRSSLSDSGVNIATYSGASYIRLKDTSVRLAYREIYGEGAMKCALEIKVGDKDILYLGSGMLMSLTRDLAFELISRSDTVIFGAHGRKYEPSYELYLVFDNLESIFILGDGIFLSDNAARAYKENGTVIVTDRDTVISIKH